ncbi:aspartyl/asparaginyl beta-hydroxylase domain-containing protein [Jatrophihabitans sp.]|uniref:aspartyl/asparaginyl beta-hydroxylase domain-containing protein n=1 Tax=Jatrophihabitans sp. TaxID=1932789 RepID=UPI0030C76274|nr:hypothetical protein [Jatrophihabitans sp.]
MIAAHRLPIVCDLTQLQADLAAVAPAGWHPHFNTGYYDGDWSGIPLRGQPGIHVPLYTDPSRSDFADLPAMSRCSAVPAILGQLPHPIESVRFLRLSPGSSIHQHRDHGLRWEEGVARLHVPVHTNPEVEFVSGGSRLVLAEGECWYIDFDLPHEVHNRGASDRVHLVIDVRVAQEL